MFVHRFNLPFPFWFINCRIQRAPRLCYCCCPLAVCLGQLRLILSGVDWTLQMSAYNLLIPFISLFFFFSPRRRWWMHVNRRVCAHACSCARAALVKGRWGWALASVCWKWVDLICSLSTWKRKRRLARRRSFWFFLTYTHSIPSASILSFLASYL